MSKLTVTLSLLALPALSFALGCSSGTCPAIPDGVYVAIGPDGGPVFTAAYVVAAAGDGAPGDALTDGATTTDGASRDAATARDADTIDAAVRDAGVRDAATTTDAGRDVTDRDAATAIDAGRDAAVRDAAVAIDAARDADPTRDAAVDATTAPDAATTVDAGDGGATGGAVTYTFHGGLPAPYDTWDCKKPAASCEMTYVCKQGDQTIAVVTYYAPGAPGALAFSVTPPGTIVHLQPR